MSELYDARILAHSLHLSKRATDAAFVNSVSSLTCGVLWSYDLKTELCGTELCKTEVCKTELCKTELWRLSCVRLNFVRQDAEHGVGGAGAVGWPSIAIGTPHRIRREVHILQGVQQFEAWATCANHAFYGLLSTLKHWKAAQVMQLLMFWATRSTKSCAKYVFCLVFDNVKTIRNSTNQVFSRFATARSMNILGE